MMASSTSMNEPSGNACLKIGLNLKIDLVEDEDDAEAAPKELFDLIDRNERRS